MHQGNAAVVWSDDFNDGNYVGWTVDLGNYMVVDNYLKGQSTTNAIYHPSTIITGTWSFDVYFPGYLGGASIVFFMANQTARGFPDFSYQIKVSRGAIELKKNSGWIRHALDNYYPTSAVKGWQHIDVTRDSNGAFCVYVNGSLKLQAVDTEMNFSSYFLFYCEEDEGIDNIRVSNTIDVSPTDDTNETTPPPGIPGFPWIGIALGIIIAMSILLIKRRRLNQTLVLTVI